MAIGWINTPNNPVVHAKGDRHGIPRKPEPVGSVKDLTDTVSHSPVTRHTAVASRHVETVGWMNGQYHEPTHPNAQAKAAGNSGSTARSIPREDLLARRERMPRNR